MERYTSRMNDHEKERSFGEKKSFLCVALETVYSACIVDYSGFEPPRRYPREPLYRDDPRVSPEISMSFDTSCESSPAKF